MSAPAFVQAPPSATRAPLQQREDTGLSGRLALSAATPQGHHLTTAAFHGWLADQATGHRFKVSPLPFDELDGWTFQPGTGNLVHHTGRFFSVEGVHVSSDTGPVRQWNQPIIRQPEVGILGILVKEFDGVLHFLMQAKMEPGNPHLIQLSPTVQATRSNYTKVHRGADVRYLDYFVHTGRGRILADGLQSEHGSWFLHKSNRNMVVEAMDDVPLYDDFCWLTLGQIGELLRCDNLVNMDARAVLACLPVGSMTAHGLRPRRPDAFTESLDRSQDPAAGALHTDVAVLSWLAAERSRRGLVARSVALTELSDWECGSHAISHREKRYFDVVGVGVEAGNREVSTWCQPLIAPRGMGMTAFLTKQVHGVLHVLAHARAEAGFQDTVELAPTVMYTPASYDWLPVDQRPAFRDLVLQAGPETIRYDAVHSEEGGRFLNAESRYQVIEVPEDFATEEPEGYRWVTLSQLTTLMQHGHYLNVQARTLLACLNLLPADPS